MHRKNLQRSRAMKKIRKAAGRIRSVDVPIEIWWLCSEDVWVNILTGRSWQEVPARKKEVGQGRMQLAKVWGQKKDHTGPGEPVLCELRGGNAVCALRLLLGQRVHWHVQPVPASGQTGLQCSETLGGSEHPTCLRHWCQCLESLMPCAWPALTRAASAVSGVTSLVSFPRRQRKEVAMERSSGRAFRPKEPCVQKPFSWGRTWWPGWLEGTAPPRPAEGEEREVGRAHGPCQQPDDI